MIPTFSPENELVAEVAAFMEALRNSKGKRFDASAPSSLAQAPAAKRQTTGVRSDLPLPPLPAGWQESQTDQGKSFYINTVTQETTWNRPMFPAQSAAPRPPSFPPPSLPETPLSAIQSTPLAAAASTPSTTWLSPTQPPPTTVSINVPAPLAQPLRLLAQYLQVVLETHGLAQATSIVHAAIVPTATPTAMPTAMPTATPTTMPQQDFLQEAFENGVPPLLQPRFD